MYVGAHVVMHVYGGQQITSHVVTRIPAIIDFAHIVSGDRTHALISSWEAFYRLSPDRVQ